MPDTVVCDLSHWNWIPQSLKPAAASGVRGMIHKVTEGPSMVDDKMPARFYLARDAGMLVGGYHFLRPGNMQQQADFFLNHLTGYMDDYTLLAADYEDSRVSLADLRTWIAAVEKRAKRTVVLYSGHVLKDALKAGQDPGDLVDQRLWLAQYGPAPELPTGWSDWWLWQWTDRGTVPGIDPPVDCNDFPGSDADLVAEWSGGDSVPPTPLPPSDEIVVKITVPPGVRVEVTEG
jgi:GH25 family lysozyme M1 (1,4-beta-N-acetylmuramidase)